MSHHNFQKLEMWPVATLLVIGAGTGKWPITAGNQKKSLFVGAHYAEGAMRREESLVDGKNTNNCDEAEK